MLFIVKIKFLNINDFYMVKWFLNDIHYILKGKKGI